MSCKGVTPRFHQDGFVPLAPVRPMRERGRKGLEGEVNESMDNKKEKGKVIVFYCLEVYT